MKQFTAVLRRAGLQADKSLVTVESLYEVADETTTPFSIFARGFTGPAIGRVTRVWVEDGELRGAVELTDVPCGAPCATCDPESACPPVGPSLDEPADPRPAASG